MHNICIMKRHLTKLSELQATLLVSGIISLVLIGVSAIGFAFNQPGWMIGVAIGGLASLVSIYLTFVSSNKTLKESKAGFYLLAYFTRMILFVGLFAMLVVFQYVLEIPVFKNSAWGMFIAFFPSVLVTVIVQLMYKGGNDGQVH